MGGTYLQIKTKKGFLKRSLLEKKLRNLPYQSQTLAAGFRSLQPTGGLSLGWVMLFGCVFVEGAPVWGWFEWETKRKPPFMGDPYFKKPIWA